MCIHIHFGETSEVTTSAKTAQCHSPPAWAPVQAEEARTARRTCPPRPPAARSPRWQGRGFGAEDCRTERSKADLQVSSGGCESCSSPCQGLLYHLPAVCVLVCASARFRPLPCLAGCDLGVVRSPQPHPRQPSLLWEMPAAGVESSTWPGPSACLGTRLVQCCKSGVALTVNTLQQKLQIIIVECFIAVIKL